MNYLIFIFYLLVSEMSRQNLAPGFVLGGALLVWWIVFASFISFRLWLLRKHQLAVKVQGNGTVHTCYHNITKLIESVTDLGLRRRLQEALYAHLVLTAPVEAKLKLSDKLGHARLWLEFGTFAATVVKPHLPAE